MRRSFQLVLEYFLWGSTGQASQKRIGQLQEDHPDYQREKRREREGEKERASPIREKKETQ